jgi:hypothetical protein
MLTFNTPERAMHHEVLKAMCKNSSSNKMTKLVCSRKRRSTPGKRRLTNSENQHGSKIFVEGISIIEQLTPVSYIFANRKWSQVPLILAISRLSNGITAHPPHTLNEASTPPERGHFATGEGVVACGLTDNWSQSCKSGVHDRQRSFNSCRTH